MKRILLVLTIIISFAPIYSEGTNSIGNVDASILYQQGNEQYKLKKFDDAKSFYLQILNKYPKSTYVPYSLYMLSFIETDYIKIIDYLSLIKDQYTDFRYWTNAVEKLGDVFYVMGNYPAATGQYKEISTDKSLYMLSLIYSANGANDPAIQSANKLLIQTQSNDLSYKAFLIIAKIYLDTKRYQEAYPILQQALKLKKWAFDSGARVIFYSGKYYFYQDKIENHYEKSLYIFSLLKTNYPLSVEATMANNYLSQLKKSNINKTEQVRWIADNFTTPAEPPYQSQTVTAVDEAEQKAEEVASEAEGPAGNMVKAQTLEYVVRIGEYKDLSVANMVARDIIKNNQNLPLGIYYRNDLYYAEIRGIKKVDDAKEFAKKLLAMGYKDTKVVEFMKVVEYNQ